MNDRTFVAPRLKKLLLVAFVGATLLSGCSLPLKQVSIPYVSQAGSSDQKTMGEKIYKKYRCPCLPLFRLDRDVAIDGQPTLRAGSKWVERWENIQTGQKLLTDPVLFDKTSLGDADFAVVLESNGYISEKAAITQFRGAKAGRTWSLKSAGDAAAMTRDGFFTSGPSWEIVYLGPDRADKRTLRFSIVDRQGSASSETKGQIEYVHSLDEGNELAIRGVTLKIEDVAPNGSIRFSIVSEGPSDY